MSYIDKFPMIFLTISLSKLLCVNNNNNNDELYSVHIYIHTYIQVADVGMIESGYMAAH